MSLRRPLAVLCAGLALAGCSASFPEVDAAVSPGALAPGYPALAPVDDLRVAAAARPNSAGATTLVASAGADAATETAAIDARAERLRARAAGLSGEAVIDAAARDRLAQPVEIPEDDV